MNRENSTKSNSFKKVLPFIVIIIGLISSVMLLHSMLFVRTISVYIPPVPRPTYTVQLDFQGNSSVIGSYLENTKEYSSFEFCDSLEYEIRCYQNGFQVFHYVPSTRHATIALPKVLKKLDCSRVNNTVVECIPTDGH